MDDFMEPTQGEVPADDSFGMPAGDMGGMDLGGAPPLADAGGFGDADFGVMGGAPPLADADDMGGLGDFGGAPPLEVGGGLDLGGEDAFGIGGGAPPLGGSADDFGMAGLSVGEEPPQFAPMGGMDMGGMDMGGMGMGGMDMGGMAEPPSAEEPLPVFGQAAPPSAMPDFSAPTMGPLAEWRMAQETKLSAKAQAAAEALATARAEAAAEIERFYAERKIKSEKRAVVNREAEVAYIQERDATMANDSWEGVCKLVDLKEKDGEKDKEKKVDRMRGLLFKLKSN